MSVPASAKAFVDNVIVSKDFELSDRDVPRCLRDYQEKALDRCVGVPGFVFGHDMGTGKSFSAIKYLLEREVKIALISCPKSVMSVWPREFAKFKAAFPSVYKIDYKIIVLDDSGVESKVKNLITQIKNAAAKKLPIIVIINYDSIWRAPLGMTVENKKVTSLGVLGTIRWQCHIMDEVHRIKDPKSKASLYCYYINKKIQFRLGLSGTPMPHSPLDLYGVLRAINWSILGVSFFQFKQKFAKYKDCGGFKKFIGMQNETELHRLIYQYIDIIRSDDVLSLPEIQHIPRYVKLGPKAMKAYKELENRFFTEIEDGSVTVSTALVKMLRLNQITGGSLPVETDGCVEATRVDFAKEEALEEIMEDLPDDEPIIVFSRFKHECEITKNVFKKLGRRYGELTGSKNDLQDFLDGKIDCLAVQIRSGGVGVDFTRARINVYLNTGLSLGDFKQSLKRSHRSGQTRDVIYYHIIAEGTIDEDIYASLEGKEEIVEQVMKGIEQKILEKRRLAG